MSPEENRSEVLRERLPLIPMQPGVYMFKDKNGKVIYVGKAKALRNRLRSYFQDDERLDPKVRAMMRRAYDLDYIVTATEVEALVLECNLIKEYHPRYNIMLRDDKSYPYLKVTTGEMFPRVVITREKERDGSRYFGPYTSVSSLRETVKLLTSLFPLRTCKSFKVGQRACLNRDIGRCPAPCQGGISPEDYRERVNSLIRFLEGDHEWLLKDLEKRMKEAAARLDFEMAARCRDQLNAVKQVVEKQQVALPKDLDLDILVIEDREKEALSLIFRLRNGRLVGKDTNFLRRGLTEDKGELISFLVKRYYDDNADIPPEIALEELPQDREVLEEWLKGISGHQVALIVPRKGDKRRILEMARENARILMEERGQADADQGLIRLSRVLGLEVVPRRIECYDISHLSGEETVGSMVVATDGRPDKSAYRRFKVEGDRNDDFASLRQVIERRLRAYEEGNPAFSPLPDLMLIDGGLGQVNAVKGVLSDLGYDFPVIGLAKKNEEIYLPGKGEPLRLPLSDEGLRVLARLRDEAHRFAVEYNRQRREKKLKRSALDEIKGIGSVRRQNLLQHFGSLKGIEQATLKELMAVPGMDRRAAEAVFAYFHPASRGDE